MIVAGLIVGSIIAMFVVTSILSKQTPKNKASPRGHDEGRKNGDGDDHANDDDASDDDAANRDNDSAEDHGVQSWQQAVITVVRD